MNVLLPSRVDTTKIVAIGSAVVVVLVASAFVTRAVERLGIHIPQQDIAADYSIGLLLAVIAGASIVMWPVRAADKIHLGAIWVAKCFVTLVLMLFYEAYYPFLDAYSYFRVPQEQDFEWAGFAIGQGTENLYSLVWLYFQVIPHSYHGLKIVCAMVGLLGSYVFYRAGVLLLGREDLRVLYVLALFPSILFWSSILGKEPFMLLAIALYAYGAIRWSRMRQLQYLAVAGTGVILAIFIRSWLGPILLLPFLYLWFRITSTKSGKLAVVIGGAAVQAALVVKLAEQFVIGSAEDLMTMLGTLSRLYAEEGGSGQQLPEYIDLTEPWQALAFLPLGMFTALFRPLPGEVLNVFGLLAGIESAVLLWLCARAISTARLQDLRNPLIVSALGLLLLWAALYGFMSYHNLGTAVRYRFQVLPVLIGVVLYLTRRRWRHYPLY